MSNDRAEFLERLQKSQAVKSLDLEFKVAESLLRKNWVVAHGAYFTDPIEHKPRELDVRARKILIKGEIIG